MTIKCDVTRYDVMVRLTSSIPVSDVGEPPDVTYSHRKADQWEDELCPVSELSPLTTLVVMDTLLPVETLGIRATHHRRVG